MRIRVLSCWNHVTCLAIAAAACWLFSAPAAVTADEGAPETVLVTLRVKPGREVELEKVLAEAWTTYERLHLVLAQPPHLVLRGVDEKKAPFFAEVLTWTSAAVPDHAPAEVLALWSRMHGLCEARVGHPDIEFSEMRMIGGEERKK